MRFSDALDEDEPAYEIFMAAMDTVFDEGDGITEYIDRLSREARLVYLLWSFEGEIHNGGFDQLFVNSLGNHCHEILDHLKEVGAARSHALLLRAMSWFPGSSPARDRAERGTQLDAFSEDPRYEAEMDRLNAEFYKYEDDLAALLNSYVGRHPDATVEVSP